MLTDRVHPRVACTYYDLGLAAQYSEWSSTTSEAAFCRPRRGGVLHPSWRCQKSFHRNNGLLRPTWSSRSQPRPGDSWHKAPNRHRGHCQEEDPALRRRYVVVVQVLKQQIWPFSPVFLPPSLMGRDGPFLRKVGPDSPAAPLWLAKVEMEAHPR